MTNLEIRKNIDACKKRLNELYDPQVFTLIGEIEDIMRELEQVRSQCKHDYIDGYCKWCDKEQE